MADTITKLNPKWITQTRKYFLEFLKTIKFPGPVRNETCGSQFNYPEWMIMFIAILSVKPSVPISIETLPQNSLVSRAKGVFNVSRLVNMVDIRERIPRQG